MPGLTGIVGPNGCGKSNVVEALRWAMGETSARSLRGGEMDDVIFAGTTARSSRNLAEVTITLARGPDTPLPDPFGADDELHITRRIERGAGSAYRANGREMRARDVQTLFADLSSGARSCAMVSQGRVSALVQASPEDRRAVLEEAAGITGLHARRHEAELKLRAAEANSTRAEELRAQLDTGREALRRQARQAARYRNISGLVRAAEAEFLAVLHARAHQAGVEAEAAQALAQLATRDAALAAEHAAAELAEVEAALPGLRDGESEARRLLERRRAESESLAGESARAEAALAESQARLATIRGDLADAAALEEDAAQALDRLGRSAVTLRARLDSMPASLEAAQAATREAALAASRAEAAADLLTARAAEAGAAASQAALAEQQAAARAASSEAALREAQAAMEASEAALVPAKALGSARDRAEQTDRALDAARHMAAQAERESARANAEAARAEAALAAARDGSAQARQGLADAAARLARLEEAGEEIARDLSDAVSARVCSARLEAAQAAQAAAQAAERAAEDALDAAARAHGEAAASCVRADAMHERLASGAAQAQANLAGARQRRERLHEEAEALRADLARQHVACPSVAHIAEAESALGRSQTQAGQAGTVWRACTARREAAERALGLARAQASAASAECARLVAEQAGTQQAARGDDTASGPALIEAIGVPPGLEVALGAILADAPASLEGGEAMHFWRGLPPCPAAPAPAGCAVLDTLVHAPAELARALSHAALLAEGADGDVLQASLGPGWVLVSRQGDLWRWDGQVCRAGAPTTAARRLRLLARLREIAAALEAAERQGAAARLALDEAEACAGQAGGDEACAQSAFAAAEAALAEHHRRLDGLVAAHGAAGSRIAMLEASLARVGAELGEAELALADAGAAMAEAAGLEGAEAAMRDARAHAAAAESDVQAARAAREAARGRLAEAVAALAALREEAGRAESRVAALLPQQARVGLEREAAAAQHAALSVAWRDMPDLEGLAAAAALAGEAAREAARALEAARDGLGARTSAQEEAARARVILEREDAQARVARGAAQGALSGALAAQAREAAALLAARGALDGLADAAGLAAEAALARQALAEARAAAVAAGEEQAAMAAVLAEARASLPGVEQEQAAWGARRAEAARRAAALAVREGEAARAVAACAAAPGDLAGRVQVLAALLDEAEAGHADAARAVRAAEARAGEAARARLAAEGAQSAWREALARGEGRAEAARAAVAAVLARAVERLGAEASLPQVEAAGEPEEERARRRHERLVRERDEMGPVNLRAEIELGEIEARLAGIDADREELATAIAKLRGSIGHLNREGRERLREVFARVDAQFRTLFTRMMGGGRAHLALVGSDDPLEAGLEIYAEPPGKKLSALSLLSGGEQALTALSLIFAVFSCTPAPVAVLDEVDAPLDDVNVERFCGLLDDVVRETGTRFLVVTHHQLTMSRMDRLYGVTMQERGVSRVLSVDLQRAAGMVMQAAE